MCTRLALGYKTRPDTHKNISDLSGFPYSKNKDLYWPTLLLVLPSLARGEQHSDDIPTSEEPLWVPIGMCRQIKWGNLTSKAALQPPMCKETLKSPGCSWKGRSKTVVVVKGQPTSPSVGRGQVCFTKKTCLQVQQQELSHCKASESKGKRQVLQHKGINSIEVHGSGEQVQEAEFLLPKVRMGA